MADRNAFYETGKSSGLNFASLLLFAAVFYNAVLAIINAHVFSIGASYVALAEILIILSGGAYAALHMREMPNIRQSAIFLAFMFAVFIYVSFMNDGFYLKSYRDMLLLAVFFVLGCSVTEKGFVTSVRIVVIAVLAVMLIELFATDLYAALFQPALYYAGTRGIEELSTDSSGLFRNALGYENRFSFGLFGSHRTSSVFLEQVSLANFAMVLAIILCVMWGRLKNFDRFLWGMTVPLIILSNSSRTGSIICLTLLAGYFIFPRLPRYSHLFWIPVILLLSAIFFYDPQFDRQMMGDDLRGRIGLTMHYLSTLDTAYFTGGNISEINRTGDTGYTYLVYTQTILGAIAFWMFLSFCLPPSNAENRKFLHAASLYIGVNLLIGAAIFSIKVSAPLWFAAGYLYHQTYLSRRDEHAR